jgi:hypothetical protein
MGRKREQQSWPEAIRLCRLSQDDVEMAKRLGFRPDTLIRARPDPKQRWKLPVKDWIHELHYRRFGHVLGEKPLPVPVPVAEEYDEEAARRFGEEVYWEDYWERNEADARPTKRKGSQAKGAEVPAAAPTSLTEPRPRPEVRKSKS